MAIVDHPFVLSVLPTAEGKELGVRELVIVSFETSTFNEAVHGAFAKQSIIQLVLFWNLLFLFLSKAFFNWAQPGSERGILNRSIEQQVKTGVVFDLLSDIKWRNNKLEHLT